MWKIGALRYIVYGTSAVLLSEVAYHGIRWLYNVLRSPGDDGDVSTTEIAEVIWTNELTQSCASSHNFDGSLKKESVNGDSVNYITELPKPSTFELCPNRYCSANNIGRLISLIDKASYSIDLAMYTFTSYELSYAIQRALKRGVDVRIISDKEMLSSTSSEIVRLTKAGTPVRCPSSTMLMHHKFCILDGPIRFDSVLKVKGKKDDKTRVLPVLMSGSLNWTMQGFGGNWENILITSNELIIMEFEREFQRIWLTI